MLTYGSPVGVRQVVEPAVVPLFLRVAVLAIICNKTRQTFSPIIFFIDTLTTRRARARGADVALPLRNVNGCPQMPRLDVSIFGRPMAGAL